MPVAKKINQTFLVNVCACILFLCISISSSWAAHFVPIQKISTVIHGRYERAENYVSFSNSGTTLSFIIPEEEFFISIEDIPQDPIQCDWFNVVVQNETYYDKILLKQGKHLYKVSVPGMTGKFIELIKATEANVGKVKIYGLELSGVFKNQPFDYNMRPCIQFIGNSITCGYGNMVSNEAPPAGNPLTGFHSYNENAYMTYAMQTARNLNAVPMLVSFSGKGIYRNYDDDTLETLPEIYDRIHLQDKNSKNWNHTQQSLEKIIPDIIVINLGTNDYAGESRNKPVNEVVFEQTYIRFVEKLIKLYPDAKIICANGSMMSDSWPAGKKCFSRIQTNLNHIKEHFQSKGYTQIYTFFFTPQSGPYGEDYHPSLATHTKMAEELTTFIQTVVNK